MLINNRKSRRRPMRYTAWLALKPNDLHGCVVSDISESGARINVEDSKIIPDHFLLMLSGNGAARRICRVMWRKPKQIGVKFEQRLAQHEKATLVPAADADKGVTRATAEPAARK